MMTYCGRSPRHSTPAGRQALLAGAYAARFDITFGMGDSTILLKGSSSTCGATTPSGEVLKRLQVSTFVPRHFAESYVRLFLRDRDDSELFDVASSVRRARGSGTGESAIAPSPPQKRRAGGRRGRRLF